MRGQGLVEYALILVLVTVVIIVILALLGPTIGNIFQNIQNGIGSPCANSQSFECKNYRVEQCLASEEYSREECIALIGGGGSP